MAHQVSVDRIKQALQPLGVGPARLAELLKTLRGQQTGDCVDEACAWALAEAQDRRDGATVEQRLRWLTEDDPVTISTSSSARLRRALEMVRPRAGEKLSATVANAYHVEKEHDRAERAAEQRKALELCKPRNILLKDIVQIGEAAHDRAYVDLVGQTVRGAIGQFRADVAAFRVVHRVLDVFETYAFASHAFDVNAMDVTDDEIAQLRAALPVFRKIAARLQKRLRTMTIPVTTQRPQGRPGHKVARQQALVELQDKKVPYAARGMFLRAWGLRPVQ